MKKINFALTSQLLKKALLELHPNDLANLYINETKQNKVKIVKTLGLEGFAKAFSYIDTTDQNDFIVSLNIKDQKRLLNALELDDLESYLDQLTALERNQLITLFPKHKQVMIKKLLSYDDKYAASIMTTEFVEIDVNTSIKETTKKIIELPNKDTYIDTIFITGSNKYLGAITIKDLVIARANQQLEQVYENNYPFVKESDPINKGLSLIKNYDISALPVLNNNHEIIGIITADDGFDELIRQHDATYQQLVAVGEDFDLNETPVKRSFKRLPWLIISVVLNLLIATVLSTFEETLSTFVALVLFQPMILGMAGNIGTQSLAVTILGINKKTLKYKKHILNEFIIGLVNSFLIGLFAVGIVFGFLSIFDPQTEVLKISIVVGLSLFFALLISALAGVFLPLWLNSMKVDEKAASGPLISTINDFCALGIYFLIATMMLMNM